MAKENFRPTLKFVFCLSFSAIKTPRTLKLYTWEKALVRRSIDS